MPEHLVHIAGVAVLLASLVAEHCRVAIAGHLKIGLIAAALAGALVVGLDQMWSHAAVFLVLAALLVRHRERTVAVRPLRITVRR